MTVGEKLDAIKDQLEGMVTALNRQDSFAGATHAQQMLVQIEQGKQNIGRVEGALDLDAE